MGKIQQKLSTINQPARALIYIAGGVLLILILLQITLSVFGDDFAAGYIKEQIEESSNGTYALKFEDLDLGIFSGSATFSGLRIHADTSAFTDTSASQPPPQLLITGAAKELAISGADILSALWGDALRIGSISLTEPTVHMLQNDHFASADTGGHAASLDSAIYAAISPAFSTLELNELTVNEGRFSLTSQNDTLASFDHFNLSLANIRVDSASARSEKLFITDDVTASVSDFSYDLGDSLNTLKFNQMSLSSAEQQVQFDSLQLEPRYGKFEYSRQKGYHSDRIEVDIPELKITGVDFESLADSGRFYAQFVEIENARMIDFLNKAYPGGPPERNRLPNVAFKQLSRPIKIDSLAINNSFISYSEYLPKAPRPGIITFEGIDAMFRRISNYKEDIQQGLTTTLDVSTNVMGTGLLTVDFTFPMDTNNGFHKIKGTLHKMDMTDFNRMLEYVAFVRIDSGQLHRMQFDMRLDSDRASGDLIMKYENLEISILDKKTIKQQGLLKNFMTFVANNFVVNKNNMPKDGMEPGRIQYQRSKYKSVFNYWWKSLLSGIKDAIK